MKKIYTRPELELELFKTEDIITASPGDTDIGWGDWGDSANTEAVNPTGRID